MSKIENSLHPRTNRLIDEISSQEINSFYILKSKWGRDRLGFSSATSYVEVTIGLSGPFMLRIESETGLKSRTSSHSEAEVIKIVKFFLEI